MVSAVDLVGLAVIVGVNTLVAALLTRLLRVRMVTRWGSMLYALLIVPVVALVLTMVFSGPLGLGPDLGSSGAVVGLTVLLPVALGMAFDYFWMPAPEEVDLPDTTRGAR